MYVLRPFEDKMYTFYLYKKKNTANMNYIYNYLIKK